MNNQEWARDIKPFEWEELDGKTLKIRAGKQEGVMIVVGYDQETKDTFVLHEEFSTPPVPTIKPGDKVRHAQYGHGDVKKISAWVWFFDGPEYKAITPGDLEVVE
ncbi:hypothetical protein [Paenibacillus sp. NPDC093718]|uniref:hypothetical protein n=1 Tax=Paenibacillus sp. NPDC093718 TaxID=3390601 RepID=UPI003CFC2AAE